MLMHMFCLSFKFLADFIFVIHGELILDDCIYTSERFWISYIVTLPPHRLPVQSPSTIAAIFIL